MDNSPAAFKEKENCLELLSAQKNQQDSFSTH